MGHYLTEHDYRSVEDWELQPRDLTIITGSEDRIVSIPKIGGFWRHTETGDVVVACDFGISAYYEVYHIPNEYVEKGKEWLKSLRLKKDKAKYSYGARVLQSKREDPEEFIQEVESYLKENSDGILQEELR